MIAELTADNLMDEYQSSISMSDALHSHLYQEYENGRILRLLIKLGLVNERPDGNSTGKNISSSWSENGDRYLLKLFRDYVFHQNDSSDPNGTLRPMLDIGHIISSLNKLDAGSTEQIILCSRDNKDLIIVSFSDVKRCLEKAITDLAEQAGVRAYDKQHSETVPSSHAGGYQSYPSYSAPTTNIQEPYLSRNATAPTYTSFMKQSSSNPNFSQPSPTRGNSYPQVATTAYSSADNYSSTTTAYNSSIPTQRINYDLDNYPGLKPTAQEWTPSSASTTSSSSQSSSGYRAQNIQPIQQRGLTPAPTSTSSAEYYNYYSGQMQPQASTTANMRSGHYPQSQHGSGNYYG